jgi:long-subunit fatty acid transport protein
MRRVLSLAALSFSLALPLMAAVLFSPSRAMAGGNEFPGGGARALGRGATDFTRADDPAVMNRNPALLADLWDDQAMAGVNILLASSCFHPTGGFDPGLGSGGEALRDPDGNVIYFQAQKGDTDLKGKPLEGFADEPYPSSCYSGPTMVLPTLALTRKLSPDLGVGLGFFPPDITALNQWGRRDGWIETPNGWRPNPARYFRSHLNVSFFTALAAAGYRVSDLLRVGGGFEWNVVAFESTTWARPTPDLVMRNDVKVDTFGRDLFIPGIILSAHIVPVDNLDVALGFKWSDRVKSKAKLDLTTGAFGTGAPFQYYDSTHTLQTVTGAVPYTMHNQLGSVSSPPIWAPQLTLGVRYAQRIEPRVHDAEWKKAHEANRDRVQDSMATERWDVEANAVVYFNSVNDVQMFTSDAKTSAQVDLVEAQAGNKIVHLPAHVGTCNKLDKKTKECLGQWEVPTYFHGHTQLSLRAGGDYNLLPGVLAMRAGFTFETDGQDPSYLNITNYMLGRMGLHAGVTWRIAGKTDISVGYAHFFQKDMRLDVNPTAPQISPRYTDTAANRAKYNYDPKAADAVGRVEVPYGAMDKNTEGPNFVNPGTYFYHLDVLSISATQHF